MEDFNLDYISLGDDHSSRLDEDYLDETTQWDSKYITCSAGDYSSTRISAKDLLDLAYRHYA